MPLRPTFSISAGDAANLLMGLLAVDEGQMRRAGPKRPRILDLIREKKLVYSPDDPQERWQTYDQMVGQVAENGIGYADCEDLATAGAAEMRVDVGAWYHDPGARPFVYRSRPGMSHVVIDSPRFGRLDPSVAGGMGGLRPPADQVALGIRTGEMFSGDGRAFGEEVGYARTIALVDALIDSSSLRTKGSASSSNPQASARPSSAPAPALVESPNPRRARAADIKLWWGHQARLAQAILNGVRPPQRLPAEAVSPEKARVYLLRFAARLKDTNPLLVGAMKKLPGVPAQATAEQTALAMQKAGPPSWIPGALVWHRVTGDLARTAACLAKAEKAGRLSLAAPSLAGDLVTYRVGQAAGPVQAPATGPVQALARTAQTAQRQAFWPSLFQTVATMIKPKSPGGKSDEGSDGESEDLAGALSAHWVEP